MNEQFGKLADHATLDRVAHVLRQSGFSAVVVDTGEQARAKILEIIPEGAAVLTMTSTTLETTGIAREINDSNRFRSVRNELKAMDRERDGAEMRRLGGAPEWTIGSVHGVTEDGQLLVASNTGSQLGAYAFGAGHVVWVVGSQKIVKDLPEGIRRIYEYTLPLEDERARKAYGVPSSVNKILILNKEIVPGRCTVILVREKLGF